MAEGGLFSGLRFTDIAFPAAAAAASMYNPYVGRGIQTGLNTFNTFAAFQDSARYYKRLKEEQERMNVGGENLRAGIGRAEDRAHGRMSNYLQRPEAEFGPLLDEGQTSQFGMFGEEGPELPDPDQEAAINQSLLGEMEGQSPGQFDLGLEGIENPRFSEIVPADLAGQITEQRPDLTEDELAMQQATEAHLGQLDLAKSAIEASPGAAANQALMAGYRGMDTDYRDADRIKDIQGVLQQREDADTRAILEKQLRLDQVASERDIWAQEQKRQEAVNRENLEFQMSGGDGGAAMTPNQYRQSLNAMAEEMRLFSAPDTPADYKSTAKFKAMELGVMIQAAGYNLPPLMEKWLEELAKEEDAANKLKVVTDSNEEHRKNVQGTLDTAKPDEFIASLQGV